jgi:hypothetical protein
MAAPSLNQFQRLVAEAARSAGADVPAEIDPIGLSLEMAGRTARILPHSDDAHAIVEVVAISLEDLEENELARLAVQMLGLNHEARFEHAWTIVLDDNRNLNVTTTVSAFATTGQALIEILYDGIDRASTLSAAVSALIAIPPPASARGMVAGGGIRG